LESDLISVSILMNEIVLTLDDFDIRGNKDFDEGETFYYGP
jgi:hypothetical protein